MEISIFLNVNLYKSPIRKYELIGTIADAVGPTLGEDQPIIFNKLLA